jgi:hypothetical protein
MALPMVDPKIISLWSNNKEITQKICSRQKGMIKREQESLRQE